MRNIYAFAAIRYQHNATTLTSASLRANAHPKARHRHLVFRCVDVDRRDIFTNASLTESDETRDAGNHRTTVI